MGALSARRTVRLARKSAMGKMALVSAILCILLGAIVFVFADGARRWYSGVFFAIMGIVMLANAWRWRRSPKG
jgi:hypothetical protein